MKIIEPATESDIDRLRHQCASHYDVSPSSVRIVHAPYRLCPLGAHVDHQLGAVSALATAHGVSIAFSPIDDPVLRIASSGFAGEVTVSLGSQRRAHDWADYARGAVHMLSRHHALTRGAALLIEGPIAEAGLSSSAAVGLGYLQVLAEVNEISLSAREMIELDRQIENDFLALKNGILDPAAIALGLAGHLTVIDCASLDHEHVPAAEPFTFVAVYSGLREALVGSDKFNNRVDECLQAGGELRRAAGEAFTPQPLGNSSAEEFAEFGGVLTSLLYKRASHFFGECKRVDEGARAFRAGDASAFGELMTSSCLSSINNYETGCPELIALFEALAGASGAYGARFSGAGFRGCCVALVESENVPVILEAVASAYCGRYPALANAVWAIQATPSNGLRAR